MLCGQPPQGVSVSSGPCIEVDVSQQVGDLLETEGEGVRAGGSGGGRQLTPDQEVELYGSGPDEATFHPHDSTTGGDGGGRGAPPFRRSEAPPQRRPPRGIPGAAPVGHQARAGTAFFWPQQGVHTRFSAT